MQKHAGANGEEFVGPPAKTGELAQGAGAGRREDAGAMAQRNAGGTLGEILGQIMAIREKPGKPESSLQFS